MTTTTLEHAGYLRAGAGLPIFIDFTAPAVYGTPDARLRTSTSFAVHHGGSRNRTLTPSSHPTPESISLLQHAIARWLPDADLVDIDVCPYDNTADEHFIVEANRRHRRGRRYVRPCLQVRPATSESSSPQLVLDGS